MEPRFVPFFILVTILFHSNKAIAQTSADQVRGDSFTNTKAYFQNETGADLHLYTGKEYIKPSVNIKGHPFFETDQMQSGEIFYDGTFYENVPLQYDIASQEVVINRYNSNEAIQLPNEKIKYFLFDGKRFENIFSIEGKDENVKSTIYEIMSSGKASVLIKRIKKIKNGLRAEDPASFVEEDEFYVRKEKNLYTINDKGSVMEAFGDKKDLIKTFIRKNKLRFKKNTEKELIITAEYYSTLN